MRFGGGGFAAGHRAVVSGAAAHQDVMYRRQRGCLGWGGGASARRKGVVRQALQTYAVGGGGSVKPSHISRFEKKEEKKKGFAAARVNKEPRAAQFSRAQTPQTCPRLKTNRPRAQQTATKSLACADFPLFFPPHKEVLVIKNL